MRFEFASEASMTLRNELTLTMADGVNAGGARLVQLSRPAGTRPADRQLASFPSAEALKAYLDEGVFGMRPSIGADFSPAPSMAAFSQTNLQEAGVDEADLVKSNGRLVYGYSPNAMGAGQPGVRVATVGAEGNSFAMRGAVGLAAERVSVLDQSGLFLQGDRLVAVTGAYAFSYSGWNVSGSFMGAAIHVEVMNTGTVDDLPVSIWRAQIEGYLVSTRRIGNRLYVVSRFAPGVPGLSYWLGATPTNVALMAATPLADLLPKVRVNGGAAASLLAADRIYMPPQGSRRPLADMIVVTAIDLATPAIAQSLGVIGTIDGIYASTGNLYFATSRAEIRTALSTSLLPEPAGYTTDIHQVRLGVDAMTLVGSGSVEGHLGTDIEKIAFRMGEHAGKLRVVSSSSNWWLGTRNRLTVLEPSATAPGLLRTLAYLPNKQRPESLGKPGELLYGTRFAGDRLYAVTFKMIDPLYVVDLSVPADPRIAGALEMPGFSEYLHPLPNGLLLGFGKDARPASEFGDGSFAWYQGLQLSLYDVGDPSRPREMQRVLLGKRGSDSALLRDHHALSTLEKPGGAMSLAFPARIHDGYYPDWGVGDSAHYPWMESGLMRFELRGTTASDARLVQLPGVITHRASMMGIGADPAASGRSVLFPGGVVYMGEGQFWHQDGAGTVSGPY